jgi:hypothetical protein
MRASAASSDPPSLTNSVQERIHPHWTIASRVLVWWRTTIVAFAGSFTS